MLQASVTKHRIVFKEQRTKIKKEKKISFWKFERCETEMVLLAGCLAMEVRAELVQTWLSWVSALKPPIWCQIYCCTWTLAAISVATQMEKWASVEVQMCVCSQTTCVWLETVSNSESIYVVELIIPQVSLVQMAAAAFVASALKSQLPFICIK